ncbi:hypothetical protein ON064_07745 [Planococcus sp. A6]|uniref:hypothetical protein n=1 Tax=Planococcus sp. A6 TaxID=2992760 RepID=UPI00237AFA3F|nr:hypothetical protein [Planococcus sp. A6]MDE0582931.1 hypothetical protein [Planococcus sp. A6]
MTATAPDNSQDFNGRSISAAMNNEAASNTMPAPPSTSDQNDVPTISASGVMVTTFAG